jgi:hypothetical protein
MMGVPSDGGGAEVVASVRDVTTTGFKWYLTETSCDDNAHASETLSWLAAVPGSHTISGVKFEVGTVNAPTKTSSTSQVWFPVNFGGGLGNTPVPLTQIQDCPEYTKAPKADGTPYYVNTRQEAVNSDKDTFNVRAQASGQAQSTIQDHVIGYVVVETNQQNPTGGAVVDAGVTGDEYTHTKRNIAVTGFTTADYGFFAGMERMDGGDPANVRYVSTSKTSTKVKVWIDEDDCGDSEVEHTAERLAYLAISTGSW